MQKSMAIPKQSQRGCLGNTLFGPDRLEVTWRGDPMQQSPRLKVGHVEVVRQIGTGIPVAFAAQLQPRDIQGSVRL